MLFDFMREKSACRYRIVILLGSLFFLFPTTANAASYGYVINVESSYSKNRVSLLNKLKLGKKYAVYSVKVKQKGKIWYKLRLGYFKSRRQANKVVKQVRTQYKGAWIDTIKKYDQSHLTAWQKSPLSTLKVEKAIKPVSRTVIKNQKPCLKKHANIWPIAVSRRRSGFTHEYLAVARKNTSRQHRNIWVWRVRKTANMLMPRLNIENI